MYLEPMVVLVWRDGDEYKAGGDAPQLDPAWESNEPLGRDELRWKIEALGVHPVDVADAFYQADLRGGYPPPDFAAHV